MTDVAQSMMDLFEGFSSAHGTHGVPEHDENSGKWAIKKTARTLREPVTLDLWRQHINGTRPLGVICIREDSMCRWGAIDIDEYHEDLIDIIKRVEQRRLPLVPCRSKSGGLHLFLFLREWWPADRVQAVLRDVAASLGLSGSEIFPKQTQVKSERGDVGNWIVMPYFGSTYDGKLKEQAGVKITGALMTIKEFIKVATERSTTLDDLMGCVKKQARATKGNGSDERGPFGDGPPCLRHLAAMGFPDGGRNNALFQSGVYFRKKHPQTWREHLDECNRTYVQNPLPSDELTQIAKSIDRKGYDYKCKDEPMVSHCNVPKCRACKFGIGNTANYPIIHSIARLMTTPAIFFVEVPGGRIEISPEQLSSFTLFNQACLAQLSVYFSPMKQTAWAELIHSALGEMEKIEAPHDLGIEGRFHEVLEDFLTNRQRGERREDLLTGRPYHDLEKAKYFFRILDLERHMDRINFRDEKGHRMSRPAMHRLIKDLKGGPEEFHIRIGKKQKFVRCWFVPSDAVTETPDFEAPEIQETI